MSNFCISDARDLLRCRGSMARLEPVSISGATNGEVKIFIGVVVGIQEDQKNHRWLITMLTGE